MIKKWTTHQIGDNKTTFRVWLDTENDLTKAISLVEKYITNLGYKSKGTIKVRYNIDSEFYEIITTLPYDVFTQNNDFNELYLTQNKDNKYVYKHIEKINFKL